jgi:hypothetical protein
VYVAVLIVFSDYSSVVQFDFVLFNHKWQMCQH